MHNTSRIFCLLACAALLVAPLQAQLAKSDIHIGLMLDFSSAQTRAPNELELLQAEIQKVLSADKSVHFLPAQMRFTEGRKDRVLTDYLSLARDPAVDLIIAAGAVSATVLAAQTALPKPTVVVGVLDGTLQKMPLTASGASGVDNFTYILSTHSIQKDLAAFYRIHPFEHLAVIISENLREALDYQGFFQDLVAPYGASVELVFWGADEVVPPLNPAIDAAYLAMVFERDPAAVAPLAAALAERQVPSFAMGRPYVDAGMMACIGAENGREQIFRKLSLIVEGIVLGENLAAMPVRLNFDEQLVLNGPIVRQLGLDLSFEILFSARHLQADAPDSDRILSLHDVVLEGLKRNLDLRIEKRNVDLAGQELRRARSARWPTVETAATLVQVDPAAAERALGQQPERSGAGTSTLQQVLFSEQVRANIEIQHYLAEAARHRADLVALDVVLSLATAYFDILLAKTGLRVQEENFEVSQRNLKIARTRNAVGYAGVADVFRWESEEANALQGVVEAHSALYLAKVQLNRLLDRADISEDFDVVDPHLSDELFGLFASGRINRALENPRDLEILGRFCVAEAWANMPSLKQLAANSKALARQQRMNRRRYYLPTVTLRGQADYTFWRGGQGVPPATAEPLDGTWNVALSLSYPLFAGNQRKIALDQTAVQQRQLHLQEANLRQQLAQAVQSRLTNLVAKQTNISFAQVSAASAQKNFELVQDAYQKGQLEIAQLVDAQRAALAARQAQAGAVYEYLLSHLLLENSMGAYTMLMTPAQQQALGGRLDAFFAAAASTP